MGSALPLLFISSFCGPTALVSPQHFTAANVVFLIGAKHSCFQIEKCQILKGKRWFPHRLPLAFGISVILQPPLPPPPCPPHNSLSAPIRPHTHTLNPLSVLCTHQQPSKFSLPESEPEPHSWRSCVWRGKACFSSHAHTHFYILPCPDSYFFKCQSLLPPRKIL